MVDVDLDRFVRAHRENYRQALAELRQGKREGQWMWFMFPQIKDLGQTSREYSLSDVREARIFLNHPMLGVHLMEAIQVLLELEGKSAEEIFGPADSQRLCASMTLFALADTKEPLFRQVLKKYFAGKPDRRTLERMGLR